MKNILQAFSIEKLKNSIKEIVRRFPVWVIIIIIVTTLFFALTNWSFSNIEENEIIKYCLTFIITFFLSISVYLSSEAYDNPSFEKSIYQLTPLWFAVLFFYWLKSDLDDFQNIIFFILSLFGIVWYLFFAPYLLKSNVKQSAYYGYFYSIGSVFLTSFLFWFVLVALWSIAIWATMTLFDLDDVLREFKLIENWMILSLAFFAPCFGLASIPKRSSFNKNTFKENAFFSFLVKYIAIPFIYIYFFILYAYSIKVISNFWDWPKWEVAWMVIWFSIFGYITYIFSYIFEEKNKFISLFRSSFAYVVIPQLFMLFYAIYLRIAQYDLTINRYFVVVFGMFLATISLYLIFSNKKRLQFIPATLTVFIIIISIWPWSVYNLPESRQFDRLIINLEKANILKDWKVTPLNSYDDIDKDLSKNIYSWINYVCDFNNCEKIIYLFENYYEEIHNREKMVFEENKQRDLENYKNNKKLLEKTNKRVFEKPSKYSIVKAITEKIKVREYYNNYDLNRAYINLSLENYNELFPINTTWYSKILNIQEWYKAPSEYAKINIQTQVLEIINNWKTIRKIDMTNIFNSLYNNYKITWITRLKKTDLTFEVDWYKIILDNISIKNPDYTWSFVENYHYINWYVLVK